MNLQIDKFIDLIFFPFPNLCPAPSESQELKKTIFIGQIYVTNPVLRVALSGGALA
jgi:hypothetical protein